MKYLSFLFALLLFAACDDTADSATNKIESTAAFVASPDQDTAAYVPLYIHNIPIDEDLNASPIPTGAFGQVLQPDMTRFQNLLLAKNYWVIDGYADTNGSNLQRRYGIGQWYRFNANGTFVGGHWDRQTHAGAWYMDFQREDPRLTIDSNVDRLDSVWEIQAINGAQDAMAMVRINSGEFGTRLPHGISARMGSLLNMPTKQQYARELGLK